MSSACTQTHRSYTGHPDFAAATNISDLMLGMVNATFESLSEEHRTVITLREVDGLSYQGIASGMSIPVGTVRSRVFRARDIIDRRLRRVYDGGLGRRT